MKEILDENEKLKKELNEKNYIINNCREKIKDLKESNWALSRLLKSAKNEVEFLKKRGHK